MALKLKVLTGSSAGKLIPVDGPRFLIGRHDECDLRPKHESVSRRHCELVHAGHQWLVRDLGSRHGTFVNGEPVGDGVRLRTGDVLRVGPLEFEVEIPLKLAARKRPKVLDVKDAVERTAAAGLVESDISDWLDDDVQAGDEGDAGRTVNATTTFFVPEPAGEKAAAPSDDEAGKKTTPSMSDTDTRQAAADVLNKYFRKK